MRLGSRRVEGRLRGAASRVRAAWRCERGTFIVEMAMVMPIFCMLMIGTCVFTMALVSYCSGTYAANVAARYASLHSISSVAPAATTDVANVLTANLHQVGTPPSPTILVYYGNRSGSNTGNYVGDLVGVSVIVFQEKIAIPFWGTQTIEMQCQAYRYISR